MQGQNDPNYRKIIKSVTSIVFLSTPHRGTNLAETLNRILRVTFLSSPKQFITELSTGSETIKKLNEQFRHVAPKLQIVSFYETKPTVVLKNAIVSETSGVLIMSNQSHRWYSRKTPPYWGTLARSLKLLMQTITRFANLTARMILLILLCAMS